MLREQQTTKPAQAFFTILLGVVIYCLFGFMTTTPDDEVRIAIAGFGTLFIWYGIVDLFRLGGGWIAWGVIALLTLGLGSAGLALTVLRSISWE